jgi:metal-responsive CopG/Arc/MetJ family transcriptional regulator
MSKSVKFAVSIPENLFKQIEELREKEGLSRSEFIRRAVINWKGKLQKRKLVRKYINGYKRAPEDLTKIKVFEKASLNSLSKEEW